MVNATGAAIDSYSESREWSDVNREVADRSDRDDSPEKKVHARRERKTAESGSAREGRAELRDHETSAKCQCAAGAKALISASTCRVSSASSRLSLSENSVEGIPLLDIA